MATRSLSPPPIDRGWAWMISIGFFLFVFFMVGLAKSFGLIMMALMKEFGVSMSYATIPITLCLIVYAFAAPCAIIIAERFSIQRVVIIGAFIGLVGISLSSLMVNMLYFTIIFGVSYGLGNSCFYGNGMIMLGKYFRRHRSFANGLALSGASIGQFALPPIIEYLLENYGLSGTILLIGAFYFHGAITGCLFRPIESYAEVDVPVRLPENGESKAMIESATEGDEDAMTNGLATSYNEVVSKEKKSEFGSYDDDFDDDYQRRKLDMMMASSGSILLVAGSICDLSHSADQLEHSSKKKGARPSFLQALLKVLDFRVLKNYITLFYTIVAFLCFFGYFNFVLFLPSVVRERGFTKYDKAILVSICGAGDLIARLAIGFFADRNFIARYRIKAIACLLCALDIFLFLFAESFGLLGVLCFFYGFFGGSYVCMVAVVLVDFVGLAGMGKNLAVILFIQGIGSSAGQPFLGHLKDSSGSSDITIIVCALTLGLGAVILFFYPFVQRWEIARQKRLQEETDS